MKLILAVSGFIVDHKTYYCYPRSRQEAEYLVALLNSGPVNEAIKAFQPEGLFGERDIHRRPFEVSPIPVFSSKNSNHARLAELARQCAKNIAKHGPALQGTLGRRRSDARLLIADQLQEINRIVEQLLSEGGPAASQPVKRSKPGRNLVLFDLL
jgi:hypothetical protein